MKQIAKWKNLKALSTCVAVIVVVLCSQRAQADTIYDAVNDFSLASNPTGVWSYGYSINLAPNYSFNRHDVSTQNDNNASGASSWNSSTQGGYPYVAKNTTGSPYTSGSVYVSTDELLLHPGPSGQYGIVRFTAPTSEIYNL